MGERVEERIGWNFNRGDREVGARGNERGISVGSRGRNYAPRGETSKSGGQTKW